MLVRGVLSVFVSILLVSGCADGGGTAPVLVEGDIPVPGSAVSLVSNQAKITNATGQDAPHLISSGIYDTQLGRSKAFDLYESWLPEGANYRGWQWCGQRVTDLDNYQSRNIEYLDRASNRAMSISILWDREIRVADPPDTTVSILLFDLDEASADFRAGKLACGE